MGMASGGVRVGGKAIRVREQSATSKLVDVCATCVQRVLQLRSEVRQRLHAAHERRHLALQGTHAALHLANIILIHSSYSLFLCLNRSFEISAHYN